MTEQCNPVNWFEIPVGDIDRAKAFYTSVFGFELGDMEMGPAKMAMFPMERDCLGAGGCLMQSEHYTPSHSGTMVYFPVAEIDDSLAKIAQSGGKMLVPKTSIGEHGHIAHFEDTEGNRVGLHQMPEKQ